MKPSQVYIRLADGKGYEMEYNEPKSIKHFLQSINDPFFNCPSQLTALSNNQEIDITKTLLQNKLKPNSIIHINSNSIDGNSSFKAISVFYESKIILFSIEEEFTIMKLKQRIENKLDIPIEEQFLAFQGKKMEDSHLLSIPSNSVISLARIHKSHKIQNQSKLSSWRFNSFKPHKTVPQENEFTMKSVGFKSAKQPKQFLDDFGPSQISEEDGNEAEQNFFQNTFIFAQNDTQEVVLCDSEVYDEQQPKKPKSQKYKIQILDEKKDEAYILTFTQEHTFQDIMNLICNLNFIQVNSEILMRSKKTNEVITSKEEIMEQIREITLPAFMVMIL